MLQIGIILERGNKIDTKVNTSKIICNESLILFSLSIDGKENLKNKELLKILTEAARLEITCNWKDAKGLSFQTYLGRIWEIPLMEKLTTRARILGGEINMDNFTKTWHLHWSGYRTRFYDKYAG